MGPAAARRWSQRTDDDGRSYGNGIPAGSGGTNENGCRSGLGKAVRKFIETHNLSPKGVTITAEDIREGLVAVLSVSRLLLGVWSGGEPGAGGARTVGRVTMVSECSPLSQSRCETASLTAAAISATVISTLRN